MGADPPQPTPSPPDGLGSGGLHDAVAAATADHRWLADAVNELLVLLGTGTPTPGTPVGYPQVPADAMARAVALRDQVVADALFHAELCRDVLLPAAWGHDLIGPVARVSRGLDRLCQAVHTLSERQPGDLLFAAQLGLLSRELDEHQRDCGPVLARIRGLGDQRRAEIWQRARDLASSRRGGSARSPHWH